MRAIGILLSAVLITGCAAPYNTNFPLVEKNMTVQKVTELLGNPISAESGPGDSKLLYYRLASSFLDTDGSDTREYWVQVKDGVVIGYGERRDAMTLQRQAQQFESAWNAVKSINQTNQALIQQQPQAPVINVVPPVAVPSPSSKTTNCRMIGSSMNCTSY